MNMKKIVKCGWRSLQSEMTEVIHFPSGIWRLCRSSEIFHSQLLWLEKQPKKTQKKQWQFCLIKNINHEQMQKWPCMHWLTVSVMQVSCGMAGWNLQQPNHPFFFSGEAAQNAPAAGDPPRPGNSCYLDMIERVIVIYIVLSLCLLQRSRATTE